VAIDIETRIDQFRKKLNIVLLFSNLSFFFVGTVLLLTGPIAANWLGQYRLINYDGPGWQSIITNLSCSLILLAGASAILDLLTRNSIQLFMRATLTQTIERMNSVAAPLANAGCSGFFHQRQDHLRDILLSSEEMFVACGTSLPDVTSFTFVGEIVQKIKQNKNYVAEFLILNPASMSAYLKRGVGVYQSDENEIVERIITAIINIERAMAELKSSEKNRMRLYMISAIPTMSCVYNEKIMDIGFYDEIRKGNVISTWRFEKIASNPGDFSLFEHYKSNIEYIKNRPDTILLWSGVEAGAALAIGKAQAEGFAAYLRQLEEADPLDAAARRRAIRGWL